VARARVRIEAHKWIAGKLKPKIYGDRVENTHKLDASETFLQFMRERVSPKPLRVINGSRS
jgi:hypothetical protein